MTFLLAGITALWFGIQTSISPCPLATNIAAISFIGKQLSSARGTLLAGLAYTAGRMLIYLGISTILVSGMLAQYELAQILQKHMNQLLGPILIVVGMILLKLINFNMPELSGSQKIQGFAAKNGVLGAGFLGMVFALSFCPTSAGLFFMSLTTLALKHQSRFVLPGLYGMGTALPVIVFAFLLAFSANRVAGAFNKLTILEKWVRHITGGLFILIGLYYCLRYIFNLF